MEGRSLSDAACWIRSLRQLMGEGGTACCAAGEGRRGGRSGFERALGLHFRMLRLVRAVIKHCRRYSRLSAGMPISRSKNSIRFREVTGRSQAFLTSLGIEQIFAYELPSHDQLHLEVPIPLASISQLQVPPSSSSSNVLIAYWSYAITSATGRPSFRSNFGSPDINQP